MEFKVGDRVKLISHNDEFSDVRKVPLGSEGVIHYIERKINSAQVEFDKVIAAPFLDNIELVERGENVKITYHDLVEKDACKEGLDAFIEEYGTKSVDVKEVYKKALKRDRSWAEWLEDRFDVEEETYRVGDEFKFGGCEPCILRIIEVNDDISGRFYITLLDVNLNTVSHKKTRVNDKRKITKKEILSLDCIRPDFFKVFKKIKQED